MAASNTLFTVVEDQKLVEMVVKFECLYDLASPLYKNQLVKDDAWKKVSEHVKRSMGDCKKRWRNIKYTYKKKLKKGKGTVSSAFIKPKHWPLADMRNTISNIELDEDDECDDFTEDISENSVSQEIKSRSICSKDETSKEENLTSDTLKSKEPFLNKRKKSNEKNIQIMEERRNERNDILKNIIENRDDDVDLFFKSIAMSVKKLKPELINEAKMKSLQMVFDLERRNTFVHLPQYSSSSSDSYTLEPDANLNDNINECDSYL